MSLIVVLGAEILDGGFGNVQLRLGQLNDRSQAQIVPPLRQLQSQRALPEKLRGDIDALVGVVRTGPSYTNIPADPLYLIPEPLIGFQGALVGGFAAGREQMAVKDGDMRAPMALLEILRLFFQCRQSWCEVTDRPQRY